MQASDTGQEKLLSEQPLPQFKPVLPKARTSIIFGIVSLGTFWFFGLIGLITGIVGIIQASIAEQELRMYPERYSPVSLGMLRAGRIVSVIATVVSTLASIIFLISYIIVGPRLFNLYFHIYNF